MYSIIFNTHKVVVVVFLLIYVIKTFLLVSNKHELLAKVVKITKVPEMIVSFLFLATGIYMAIGYPVMGNLFYIKLAAVIASIPLAVIGFKKSNKILASLSLVLLFGAYGLAEVNKNSINRSLKNAEAIADNTDQVALGKSIYNMGCQMCHGSAGDAGIAGAANLQLSQLQLADQKAIILNGKGSMPKFSNLSETQINAVCTYIDSFKKK